MKRYVHNLVFHGVGEPDDIGVNGRRRFWTTQGRFTQMLDRLRHCEDVVLTFDDGNISDVSIALPALLQHGLTARFFITTDLLGQPGYLEPAQVSQLADHGMIIGSHSVRHVNWRHLDPDDLRYEVTHSREVLEALVCRPVTEIAMPSGQYNRSVLRVLRDAGYQKVYTVDGPWARADDWLQARFPITCRDTADSVVAILKAPRHGWDETKRAGKRWIKKNRWW